MFLVVQVNINQTPENINDNSILATIPDGYCLYDIEKGNFP